MPKSPKKVDPSDLVNITMIAERLGQKRSAVNMTAQRRADFPTAVADLGGKIYLWSEVEPYFAARAAATETQEV